MNKEKSKRVTVTLPKDLYAAVLDIAKKLDVTLSWVIRQALKGYTK